MNDPFWQAPVPMIEEQMIERGWIPPEPRGHDCRDFLPDSPGGYGSTGEPLGTLRACPECGRWWVCRACYESLGPTSWWRPVRWYHRRLKQRIADLDY